jgi:hypothetical protein
MLCRTMWCHTQRTVLLKSECSVVILKQCCIRGIKVHSGVIYHFKKSSLMYWLTFLEYVTQAGAVSKQKPVSWMGGVQLHTEAIFISRSPLGHALPPIQRVSGALSLGVKWLRYEADHSPPSSAKVKNGGAVPPCSHMF